MNKSSIILVILVILLLGLVGYYFYSSGDSLPTGSSLLDSDTTVSPIGAEELAILRQVEGLNIDVKFFTNPTYLSLIDFTEEIPTLNVGRRPNPFAPIPGVPSPFGQQGR